jgi:hypothetical protein
MTKKPFGVLSIVWLLLAANGQGLASELKRIADIQVPGIPLQAFDIGLVDQENGRYYLADRTNKSLDVYDVISGKMVARIGGFAGQRATNDESGPDGVVVVGRQAWVGDGDSTVKIVDLKAERIANVISTGGRARSDENAYDPVDHVFIGVNNADNPPFAILISTNTNHKIIGKVVFNSATDGAEQPVYYGPTRQFYLSIPELNNDKSKGAIAAIDPATAKLVRMMPVEGCHPAGLVKGPGSQLLLGCTAGKKDTGLPPKLVVMDGITGAVVKNIPGIGAADMVAYDSGNHYYYSASAGMPDGPQLGVINADSNALIQAIALPGDAPHSVAVSQLNHHVFVPLGAKGGGCGGCIAVFVPK